MNTLRISLATVVMVALLATLPAPAVSAPEVDRTDAWIDGMARHFEAHPELQDTRGSGWKPYNRIKWFREQRLVNGEGPAPDARWKAWEAKREMEAARPASSRSTWFSLGPGNYAGRMLDIDFHPSDVNIVYAGSASGGLWKSTDYGSSWAPISDEIPSIAIGAVCVLPWNPDIVLIGTGEGANGDVHGVGILKSTDAGATWNTTDYTKPSGSNSGFHAMEANATTGTILAGAMDGLWRSTDDGNTWIDVKTGDDYYDVKWKPGDPNTVYTVKGSSASGNNVKISTDDGLTWAKAGTGQPSSWTVGKSKIAVTAANPDYIYALYSENSSNGGTTGVYRSTDGGSTWTQRSGANPNIGGGQGWYNLILAADPNNADRIIAGGVRLYRSTNGGTGYSQIGNWVHVDYHAVRYEPGSNSNLWVANDGGIYRSQNDGTSWTDLNNGLVTFQFYDICVAQSSPTIAVGGSQDNGTDKWTGTSNWTYILGGDGMVCNVKPTSANVIYAELYYGDHRKTSNGGTGWSQINSGITGTGAWVAPVDEDQVTPNHLYTSSSDGIFRTLNGGSNWTNVGGQTATWISISPVDGNVVWTAGSGVYQTTDDGGSWTQASPYGFSTGGVTKILAHPTDTNSAIVVFSGYGDGTSHIALTTDSGSTWTDKSSNFPSQPVNAIAVDWSNTDHWFIGTDVGVWASLDAGGSWSPFETGLPNVVVSDLEIHRSGGKLVAGTYGRGMWEVDITSMSTGVETGVQAGPRNLMLDAPWPNPVTDQATLRFAAKYAGVVTLDIHDVAGRLVSRVAEIPAGDGLIRMADWLTDDVPSGVYFAVLKAGEERISRKLIVTR